MTFIYRNLGGILELFNVLFVDMETPWIYLTDCDSFEFCEGNFVIQDPKKGDTIVTEAGDLGLIIEPLEGIFEVEWAEKTD